MAKSTKAVIVPDELIMNNIYLLRGQKVMLDHDLAKLYQVETKQLKRQVKRNISRFPDDFMFEITKEEFEILRSQFGTSNLQAGKTGWGGSRYLPMAFTEQGVAMISSVLNSETAIRVNIQIIRVFTKMRELLLSNKEILLQLEKAEKKLSKHDKDIILIFQYLKKLLSPQTGKRERIGFRKDY